jgi:hypothetical protein
MDVSFLLRRLDAKTLKPEEQQRAAEVVRTLLLDMKVARDDLQSTVDYRREILMRTIGMLSEHLPGPKRRRKTPRGC